MKSNLRIIVTSLFAQHPRLGGVSWDYLQYPLGLARLGHDVYYFEDSGEWPYKLNGGPSPDDWIASDCRENVEHLAAVMSRFGFGERWAYRFPVTGEWFGLSDQKRASVLKSADMIINVSGTIEDPRQYRHKSRLVYIDSDPVFTQVKLARGDEAFCARVLAHDTHFSFGERLSPAVPRTRYRWRPTRQPVVLSEWQAAAEPGKAFTTVMSWTSYKPLVHEGCTFGQKDLEFMRFLELPVRIGTVPLEIALGRTEHADWQAKISDLPSEVAGLLRKNRRWTARELLSHVGWQVTDAMEVCGNLDKYRSYIMNSRAEWSVAKNGYVVGQAGWFSCRSACYLAAGKPVVVQDTGFGSILPIGEGILTFRTVEEAVVSIQEVQQNYRKHAKAAREVAEAYFDSDKVLTQLIDDAMSNDASAHSGRPGP